MSLPEQAYERRQFRKTKLIRFAEPIERPSTLPLLRPHLSCSSYTKIQPPLPADTHLPSPTLGDPCFPAPTPILGKLWLGPGTTIKIGTCVRFAWSKT